MNHFADIGRNMMIADKYFKLYLKDTLRSYDLNAAEGIVLLMMYRKMSPSTGEPPSADVHKIQGANSQDELIREIHYDKGVMTRTMKELEAKGFVCRKHHPQDSRSFLFTLTEKGLALREPLIHILRQWNSHLLEGLNEETLAVVEDALSTMARNAAACYSENSPHKQNKSNRRK